ncbi:MAG TPA: DNA-formamidopyrimidine glycosylase family protein [Acidimicrobiales bacterium]|jgi:formamidopyrimidine-DNA glycosylase
MPELPDVEGFRRTAARAVAARIDTVEVTDPGVLRNSTPDELSRALARRSIEVPERRGKWLILPASGPAVVFHFGMTGSLHWQTEPSERHPHDRVTLRTGRGRLVYRDQRKLQGLWLAADTAAVDEIVGDLGPDALSLTARDLDAALSGQRRAVKAALMDQKVVAGLGNLTVDEILWRVCIHPQSRSDHLDAATRRRLHRAVGAVLRPAARAGHIPNGRGWLASQRSQPDPRCPRCGGRLAQIRVDGRRSLVCPRCQPRAGNQPR